MVGSIFSSDAWNNVTFIAGEIKNPQRNIGLSLFLGTLIVTLIYVSANVMYTAVLPMHDIAFADKARVATQAILDDYQCGVMITLGRLQRGLSCGRGSTAKTSRQA